MNVKIKTFQEGDSRRRALALLATLFIQLAAVGSNFSDANWSTMNPSLPGADGTVYATVVDGSGNLYIGGDFTVVGDVVARGVAKWDGTRWSALGSGLNGSVSALAVSGKDLYVAGSFSGVGGDAVMAIAKWDGTRWSALGSGISSGVNALAVMGNELYAGGVFTNAGGVATTNIAKWNGSTWSALAEPLGTSISALAVLGNELYAAGYSTATGSFVPSIAKLDGTYWSALGSGIEGSSPDSYGYVSALAVSGNVLYAGGRFTTAGGVAATNIARWDRGTWSALGPVVIDDVRALAASGSNLYVASYFFLANGDVGGQRIARWDGSRWMALGSGINSEARALVMSGNDLYVGGAFTFAGEVRADSIAQWNGSHWFVLGSGNGMFGTVLAVAASGSNIYAGGEFATGADDGATNVAQWNGTSWSRLGSGINGPVRALATFNNTLCAGGYFTTAGGMDAASIAQWNGSHWSALGSGVSGFASEVGRGVYALAWSGPDLYAGGFFTMAGDLPAQNIARWDGTNWWALGPGLEGVGCCQSEGVFALAALGHDLYAGGYFTVTTPDGPVVANVAKWDGTNWTGMFLGPFRPFAAHIVHALAVSGNDLYAGGRYGIVGKWDGTQWSSLGSGFDGAISTLAVSGADLYAGGFFRMVDGSATRYIAKWDGNRWTPLGSGLNGGAASLAISGSDLYVGGSFTTAGVRVSGYIARAYLSDLPVLSVDRSGSDLKVSWPSANTSGFFLEQASRWSATEGWTPNASTVADDTMNKSITVPATNISQFFRLRRP